MNRTPLAYALTIGAAEQLLRWVPQGTHTYSKFVTPDEVHAMIDAAGDGAKIRAMNGLIYDPLLRQWHLHPSRLTVNYIVHVVKGHDSSSGSAAARPAAPRDVGVSPL